MINLFTLSKAVLVIYYNSSDDGIHRGFSNLCFSLLGSYLFAELTKIGGRGAKANLLPITWSFSANKPPVQPVVNKNTLRLIQSSWRMKWPTRCISGQSWTIWSTMTQWHTPSWYWTVIMKPIWKPSHSTSHWIADGTAAERKNLSAAKFYLPFLKKYWFW